MKPQKWMVRLGWLALSCAFIGAISLVAREYYEDKELRGMVVKVDLNNKAFTLDHGDTHKLKLLFWNHKTVFRSPYRLAKWEDLTTNMPVRVYYRDDASVSQHHKAIVNKVVFNPISDPNLPEYNK